ncbi:Glutamate mutase epsilon subunit [subsurface metagenome]
MPEGDELKLEEEMISLAVKAIVDKVIDLGDGDVAIGEIKAVEQGVIDAAFSPWQYLARKVLPIRDVSGAVRYLEHGNVPLPKEVVDYHRQKVAERKQASGGKTDIEMIIDDISRFSRSIVKEVEVVK